MNKTTAVSTGLLVGLPVLSFAWTADVGGVAFLPAGAYNIGFACTKGTASATQMDRYWNTQITIEASAADTPAGLTWIAVPKSTTTTTTTTTTTASSTTTTTIAGATTTSTAASATTTTVRAGAATTTTISGVTSTPASNSTLFGSGSNTGGRTIVATGSSPIPIALWAVLLLVFGRMALLLGRPLRVLPPKSR